MSFQSPSYFYYVPKLKKVLSMTTRKEDGYSPDAGYLLASNLAYAVEMDYNQTREFKPEDNGIYIKNTPGVWMKYPDDISEQEQLANELKLTYNLWK